TDAPARASPSAIAKPMPAVEPVTTALRPFSSIFMMSSPLYGLQVVCVRTRRTYLVLFLRRHSRLPLLRRLQGVRPNPDGSGRGRLGGDVPACRGTTRPAGSPRSGHGILPA